MDSNKFDLVFDQANNTRLNGVLKQIPSKFLTSDIQWGLEVSPGERPAEPFMPNRYAPIVREIRNVSLFEKGIVIPRGTIISADAILSKETYEAGNQPIANNTIDGGTGTVPSGQIGLGIGYDAGLNLASLDDVIDGYDRIRLAAAIANGGVDVTEYYTTKDSDRGRVKANGSLVVADDTFARGKNIPIGFTTEDVYLFDNGSKLNFSEVSWNRFSSFATDYYIEMPYFAGSTGSIAAFSDTPYASNGSPTQGQINYKAVKDLGMPFFWAGTKTDMRIGNFVMPDKNGKWKAQYNATAMFDGSAYKTIQTVGKLLSYTNKFPGDLEGFVETWNNASANNYGKNYLGGTSTGGTSTFGIEYRLFVFIASLLTAEGESVNYTNIAAAMNSGSFGMARINVHTS